MAWVAERKGLLSGLFFVLTIGAYVGYVRHRFSLPRYLAVVVLFALGLMAKPMLVTLPFVLLLLDYWPLGRMAAGTLRVPPAIGPAVGEQTAHGVCLLRWLVVEKIPLFVLTAASCVATPFTQGEAVARLDVIRMSSRIANALVFLRGLRGPVLLSPWADDILSPPGKQLADLESPRCAGVAGGHLGGSRGLATTVSLRVRRLVLVPGDAACR